MQPLRPPAPLTQPLIPPLTLVPMYPPPPIGYQPIVFRPPATLPIDPPLQVQPPLPIQPHQLRLSSPVQLPQVRPPSPVLNMEEILVENPHRGPEFIHDQGRRIDEIGQFNPVGKNTKCIIYLVNSKSMY